MAPKFDLAFGNIIAHFVPGSVCFLALLARSPAGESPLRSVGGNTALFAVVFVVGSLAVGLLLDAARYLLTRFVGWVAGGMRACGVLGGVPLLLRTFRCTTG